MSLPLLGILAKPKKPKTEYTENGKVTAKTAKELEEAQVELQKFSDDAPVVQAKAPEVKTKAPTKPTPLLNKDVLLKAAKNAKKRDAPVTFDDLVNVLVFSIGKRWTGQWMPKRSWTVLVTP